MKEDELIQFINSMNELDLSNIEFLGETVLMFLARVSAQTNRKASEELYVRYGVRLHHS